MALLLVPLAAALPGRALEFAAVDAVRESRAGVGLSYTRFVSRCEATENDLEASEALAQELEAHVDEHSRRVCYDFGFTASSWAPPSSSSPTL